MSSCIKVLMKIIVNSFINNVMSVKPTKLIISSRQGIRPLNDQDSLGHIEKYIVFTYE